MMSEAAMDNCTVAPDGARICYVTIIGDDVGSRYSLWHDLKLVVATFLLSCLAIAIYNIRIQLVQSKSKKANGGSDEDDDAQLDRQLAKVAKRLSAANGNDSGRSNFLGKASKRQSFAASMAQVDGMEASGNFLSGILAQMWEHAGVAVSNSIKEALEPTLRDLKPVSLHFVRLDLGRVPIRTKNMFIHSVDLSGKNTEAEKKAGIQIDVDVEWDGDCDVMLQATVTKSAKITLGVKSLKLSGRMHILLSPLITELPVISAVQYGFTNPPSVELDFTGAVQTVTNRFSSIQGALVSAVQSTLAGVLVLPNRMVMPMDLGSYDYLETYQPPVGMVRISAVEGRGFKVLQKFILKDIPDIYCLISLGASASSSPKFRTSTRYDDLTPRWTGESCDFVLYDMDQKVYLEVMDEDKTPVDPDDELGQAEISVRDLFRNNRDGTAELELEMDGKRTNCHVTLSAEVFHLSNRLNSFSDTIMYGAKNQLCGLITIIVTKAFDIPIPREDAATFVTVTYGEGTKNEKVFYTGTVTDYPGIDALNPMFDSVFHVPVTAAMLGAGESSSPKSSVGSLDDGGNKSAMTRAMTISAPSFLKKSSISSCSGGHNDITFTLTDADGANGTKGHGVLGSCKVAHGELLGAYRHTITETRELGTGGAKLEFRVIMSGMQSEEEYIQDIDSSQVVVDPSSPPISPKSLYGGADERLDVRVTAMRGRGFTIRKRRLGKKNDVPDVYLKIRLSPFSGRKGDQQLEPWKTHTIKDDTMPTWKASKDFERVDSLRDTLHVEAWDENRAGSDELLGRAEFSLEKLLRKRILEVELRDCPDTADTYVTLMCVQLEKAVSREKALRDGVNSVTSEKDVLVHYHPQMDDQGYEATLLPQSNKSARIDEVDDEEEEADDVVAPLPSSSAPHSLDPHRIANIDMVKDDDNRSINSALSMNSTSSSRSKKAKNMFKSFGRKISGKKKKEK